MDTSGRQVERNSNIYAAKFTLTPAANHMLAMTAFGDPSERSGWLAGSTIGNATPNADPNSALRNERFGGHNFGVRYNGVLSSTWLVDANVGRHSQVSDTDAATDAGRRIPRQIDETFGLFEHSGFNRVQTDDASRIAMAVKLTNVFAQHELRYGVDAEINSYDSNVGETWTAISGRPFDSAPTCRNAFIRSSGRGRRPTLRCSPRIHGR